MADWRTRGFRWWRGLVAQIAAWVGSTGASGSQKLAEAAAELERTRALHELLTAGRQARETGDLAGARTHYEGALALSPNDTRALTGMAEALFLERSWDALLPICNQLIAVGPDPEVRLFGTLLKGRALDVHFNRPDKAEETYAVCLAWQPERPELLLRLAELALRRGEAASALGLIERGLGLPGRESGRGDLLLGRAAALAGLNRADEALDALDEASSAGVHLAVAPWIAVTAPVLLHDHLRRQLQGPRGQG